MFILAQGTPPAVPAPPPAVAESVSRVTPADPGPFCVVLGLGNPEWAHVGVSYRYMQVAGGLTLGSAALAHNLGATVRYFFGPQPGGLFAEAGATVIQLANTTPGYTPTDAFYQKQIGLGWQFIAFDHAVFNVGGGLLDSPPRAAAPPGVIVSSSLLPHFLLEAGYAF